MCLWSCDAEDSIYIACKHINIIIINRVSTPAVCYLFMDQVLLVWPANNKKKILKQQLLFSNTLCLFIAFRRSGTFKCFHATFCKVTTIEVARNSLVNNQVLFWCKKKNVNKIKENPVGKGRTFVSSLLHCLLEMIVLFCTCYWQLHDDAGVSPHSKKSQPCPLGLAQQ